jgi:ferredoxin
MTSLRDGLVAFGAIRDRIRFEAFAASQAPLALSAGHTGGACKVTFAKSGKTVDWTPRDGSLLDLALRHDIDVAYSCRLGDCETCVQRIVGGVADYPSGDMPLLAWDQVMLCQAAPRGDVVLDC